MKVFKRTEERLVYANPWIELYDDEVTTPDGKPGTFTRLRYRNNPPGVVIIPRTADGRFLLIRVSRYAMGAVSLEFPRGSADPGETPESAARRELHEETGLSAESISELGILYPDTSIVETKVHVLLAEVVTLAALQLDDKQEGVISSELVASAELREAIAKGAIQDGYTLAAFGLLAAAGRL